ncbi:hypothetical protein L1987_43462 [Smallanthus sonchifolius]|uniref:Uncharacterized protein n=1 Tax=Smallanthus sonchifolius TaxID=185202 RepID=A0ACB9GMH0_9ASTR|nr:hypothetical protein L1987_43462 [Smallanthus sonchifolius]
MSHLPVQPTHNAARKIVRNRAPSTIIPQYIEEYTHNTVSLQPFFKDYVDSETDELVVDREHLEALRMYELAQMRCLTPEDIIVLAFMNIHCKSRFEDSARDFLNLLTKLSKDRGIVVENGKLWCYCFKSWWRSTDIIGSFFTTTAKSSYRKRHFYVRSGAKPKLKDPVTVEQALKKAKQIEERYFLDLIDGIQNALVSDQQIWTEFSSNEDAHVVGDCVKATIQGFGAKGFSILVAASVGTYGTYLADGSEYRWDGKGLKLKRVNFGTGQMGQAYAELLEEGIKIPAWFSFKSKDGVNVVSGDSLIECAKIADSCQKVVAIGINCTPPRFNSGLIQSIKKLSEMIRHASLSSVACLLSNLRSHAQVSGIFWLLHSVLHNTKAEPAVRIAIAEEVGLVLLATLQEALSKALKKSKD